MSAWMNFARLSVALVALSGCTAVMPGAAPAAGAGAPASISISVGPCFGFCPVYDAAITVNGAVTFTGHRHTAVLGTRERSVAPQTYRALEAELAPFKPTSGKTTEIPCTVEISDMPTYTISWTGPAAQAALATHRGGCREGAGHDLDIILRTLPQRLGI